VDPNDPAWWRRAVFYQIYIRSFADADGDGIGDIAGIRSRLPYLRDLGVDALWINPWYPSPMADGGYDVADYRDIDPRFGTLEQAVELFAAAQAHGLKVLVDIVPNHTSDQHAWFQAALALPAGSPERRRYHFRDGRGPEGTQPPTNWASVFGGPAWTRTTDQDGHPGQWYLHLFDASQPDLDWSNPEVRAEFESIIRFWLDRGADGFRIDVAHSLTKDPAFPDVGPDAFEWPWPGEPGTHPHWDRDDVHEVYRTWRAIADTYAPSRVFVGEIDPPSAERRAHYLRADELHMAFDFDFLGAPWDAAVLRTVIGEELAAAGLVGSTPTWVLSNHDRVRHVTRFGRADTSWRGVIGDPVDLDLGRRRARAAVLLMLGLPGVAYLYQGEELGLAEAEDLPIESLQDPVWTRSGHTDRGRDGCRVPLPWDGHAPPFGFGPPGTIPWLPQPADWATWTVAAEVREPGSMLSLYRAALALRRSHPGFASDAFRWLDASPGVLHVERDRGLGVVVNLSTEAVDLPAGATVLLSSVPLVDGRLPGDAAAWVERRG
jgi:alpha-glucosidase